MTAAAFRKLALSLAGVTEQPHFERTSFRVGKKIVATMTSDGREAMTRVAPRDKLYRLLREQPDVFFSHKGWTARLGAVGIRLAKADAKLIAELLGECHQKVSSKSAKSRS
jgi:hypothetical protein